MTLGERLRKAMDHAGLNPYRLAKLTDLPISAVTRALDGTRTHHEHTTIVGMAVVCGVRAEWLSLEQGPMLEQTSTGGRLSERCEWKSVAERVRRAHRELAAEDIAAVGEIVDGPAWAAVLDAPLVATLAAARRAWLTRVSAPE